MTYRYKTEHGSIRMLVTIEETIGTIMAITKNLSIAELSDLGPKINIKGLNKPVYYFNRIKCKPRIEGTGEGKALMIEICKLADEHKITILNELNPYGKRDMDSLKKFFKASGFETFNLDNTMVRIPRSTT